MSRHDVDPGPSSAAADNLERAPGRRFTASGVLAAYTVTAGVAFVFVWIRQPHLIDLAVYRVSGRAVARGVDPYSVRSAWKNGFTYPPFAALLVVPLGVLRAAPVVVVWIGLQVAALESFVASSLPRWVTGDRRLMLACVLALGLEPVWQHLVLGQINLFLAAAIFWDLLGPPSRRGRGLLTGLAVGVKLTPAVFVVLLLLTGQRRAARWALVGFMGTVLVGALLLPSASLAFWTRYVFDSHRVGDQIFANDQSLHAMMLRAWPHEAWVGPAWIVLAVAAGLGGVLVGRAWWRRGEHVLALGVTGLAAVLASPVSWSHHWVWCLPLIGGLVCAAERAGLPRLVGGGLATAFAAVFVLAPHLWVPRFHHRELRWSGVETVLGNGYVWVGLLTVGYLALLARRTPLTPASADGRCRACPHRAGAPDGRRGACRCGRW